MTADLAARLGTAVRHHLLPGTDDHVQVTPRADGSILLRAHDAEWRAVHLPLTGPVDFFLVVPEPEGTRHRGGHPVLAVAADGASWAIRRPEQLAALLASGRRIPPATVAALTALILGTGAERVITSDAELPLSLRTTLHERGGIVVPPVASPAGWAFTTLRPDPAGGPEQEVRQWTVAADPFDWTAETTGTT
ncbi:hypothetical protein [Actinoplanes sp. NBRC 103695]|uniref:hypothetical protein n=1 Tax=Actinoplanes sp. NBRC 103695 TaxID=3032202 RepID=UPI0024A2B490|nr:hypothetical protein [Actinoplanes sp. NBRC 103695]GLY94105.1 hypothetical protein Acsp02_13610 [Actinoplanes sp. NBRC 103695]